MIVPGAPSLCFLAFLFVVWPWISIRSAREMLAARGRSGGFSARARETSWKSTLVTQIASGLFAWWVGNGFGLDLFAVPSLGWRELLAAIGALAVHLSLRAALRAICGEAERRQLPVYAIAPRGRREWKLWCATVLIASVSEEIAYRGVAMAILWWTIGNAWVAALLAAFAFSIAHVLQGWKSMATIFLMSLVMQALVMYTHTLLLAMIVHAVYNFIAGARIRREALALDAE